MLSFEMAIPPDKCELFDEKLNKTRESRKLMKERNIQDIYTQILKFFSLPET